MASLITASIGTSKIKICELNTSIKGAVLRKASTIRTPEGSVDDGRLIDMDAVAQVLKEEIAKQGMESKEITFVLKYSKLAYKEVFIPAIKANKVQDMIKANASDYFPVDIENYIITGKVISQVVTADNEKQLRVGVYAVEREMAESYYELANRIGLIVKNLESDYNATVSFLNRQIGPETSVVLHVHDDSTTVNIFRDNILEFQRRFPYGKNIVVDAVMAQKRLNRIDAERVLANDRIIHDSFDGDEITETLRNLTNSIVRVVDYFNSRNSDKPVEKVYVTGESVGMMGLDSLLSTEFDMNVMNLISFDSVEVGSMLYLEHKMISVYISCVGAVFDPINFVPDNVVGLVKNDKVSGYLKFGVLGALVVGAALIAVAAIKYFALQLSISDYEEKIEKIRDIEIIVNQYYDSTDMLTDATNFENMSSSVNDYAVELLLALEKGMPSDVSIDSISVSGGEVSVTATSSGKPSIAKFITQLKGMPGVSNVFVSSSSEVKDASEIVTSSFSIRFTFNKMLALYVQEEIIEQYEFIEMLVPEDVIMAEVVSDYMKLLVEYGQEITDNYLQEALDKYNEAVDNAGTGEEVE